MVKVHEFEQTHDTHAIEAALRSEGVIFEMRPISMPYAGFGTALFVDESDIDLVHNLLSNFVSVGDGSSIVCCPLCRSSRVKADDEKGGCLNFLILPMLVRFLVIKGKGNPYQCLICGSSFRFKI